MLKIAIAAVIQRAFCLITLEFSCPVPALPVVMVTDPSFAFSVCMSESSFARLWSDSFTDNKNADEKFRCWLKLHHVLNYEFKSNQVL